MFSTRTPAAVQRIPWPSDTSKASSTRPEEEHVAANKWIGHDTWFMNSSDLPWLLQDNGTAIYTSRFITKLLIPLSVCHSCRPFQDYWG